mgnify:CR=1 FL=1
MQHQAEALMAQQMTDSIWRSGEQPKPQWQENKSHQMIISVTKGQCLGTYKGQGNEKDSDRLFLSLHSKL